MNRRAATTTSGANVIAHGSGCSTIPPSLLAEIAQEIGKARVKYPERDLESRIDGFLQEASEASQAVLKLKYDRGNPEKLAHAELELKQCAGQIIRLFVEALR